tara:strand:+ start:1664 stop:2557 length:894 start_codon:yes stop_codon:yes gene_type:complete
MSEETTTVEVTDAQSEADFNAGFLDTVTQPDPAAPAVDAKVEEKTKEPEPAKADATPAVVEPEYVQVTKAQFEALQTAATKTATIEGQLSKAFGTLGDVQQIVRKLQTATPAGVAIEIPADAFADLEKDFPELAAQMRSGLEKTLKNVKGTAPAAPAPEVLEEHVTSAIEKRELKELTEDYPDWRTIVGPVDPTTGKFNENNAFRKWLATQHPVYQKRVNTTGSPVVVARAIERFQDQPQKQPEPTPQPKTAAKPAAPVVDRAARLRAAVPIKGDGGSPTSTPDTAEAELLEGFRSR